MLETHAPLLVASAIAVGLGALILVLGAFLGPRRPSRIKEEAFEGGNPSSGDARHPFHVRFYLVAILFLVFDIEGVFMVPWAVIFRRGVTDPSFPVSAGAALLQMTVFMAVLLVGLVYAWRKGALEWAPKQRQGAAQAEPPKEH